MRRLLLPIIAVIIACNAHTALAGQETTKAAPKQQVQTQQKTHVHRTRYQRRRRPKRNFFAELMELERRKNAWLMRTFLGR